MLESHSRASTLQIGFIVAGRETPDQLIVNSNIGMAVCDVVVGKAIYDRALAQNAGTTLGL